MFCLLCFEVGGCATIIDEEDLAILRQKCSDDDYQICFSEYEQGIYRVMAKVERIEPLSPLVWENLPDQMKLMDICMHVHNDENDAVYELKISEGKIFYRTISCEELPWIPIANKEPYYLNEEDIYEKIIEPITRNMDGNAPYRQLITAAKGLPVDWKYTYYGEVRGDEESNLWRGIAKKCLDDYQAYLAYLQSPARQWMGNG
jgi:hypothetical protein